MYDKYLVTGATGFLGSAVTAKLVGKNGNVRALVRENDPLVSELPTQVDIVFGDLCDDAVLERFFRDADERTCVIHCAGIVSVASRPGAEIYRVNVGGTEKVLRRCIDCHIGKFIYVSSVHAIPEKPKGAEITENTVVSPELVRGAYGKSKAAATALVFAAAKRGLNASVVFPSGIIGPGDRGKGSITNMLMSFMAGKLPLAVRGGYDFVDVRDVASGILACTERGLPGRGYILSGHYATIREILETVKQSLNIKRRVSYLPIFFAKLIAPIYEKWSLWRSEPLYFTPEAVSVLDSNGGFSRRAAGLELGYVPRPLKETIRDTVLWIKHTPLKGSL